eukprot:GEMP01026831.1.p1 GENE.GEMP01026831.1~~GEMP01026831.1.p1  ORF type:complete len:325 (+),score=64.09 GEMP01026831.1:375-1349(+)
MAYRRVLASSTGGWEDGSSCNLSEDFDIAGPENEPSIMPRAFQKWKPSAQKMSSMAAGIPLSWWNIASYILALGFLVAFYALAHDSSSLLTLASAFQCFGVLGLFDSQHSLHTLTTKLYIFSWGFRTLVIVASKGYTPIDATGDWLHTFLELASLVLMIMAALEHAFKKQSTSEVTRDEWKITACLVATALMTGYFFHISLIGYNKKGVQNDKYIYDVLWAASTYLETVAMLPQVYRMAVDENVRQNAQFVFMSFMARSVGLIFWVIVHHSIVRLSVNTITPYLVLGAQVVQLLSISEVTYFYVKEKLQKAKELITQDFISTIV